MCPSRPIGLERDVGPWLTMPSAYDRADDPTFMHLGLIRADCEPSVPIIGAALVTFSLGARALVPFVSGACCEMSHSLAMRFLPSDLAVWLKHPGAVALVTQLANGKAAPLQVLMPLIWALSGTPPGGSIVEARSSKTDSLWQENLTTYMVIAGPPSSGESTGAPGTYPSYRACVTRCCGVCISRSRNSGEPRTVL